MEKSKYNPLITIDYLKNQSESQYFERKGIGVKATKIADELIGMLNADGGTLVFGVDDDGEIQDVKSLGKQLDKYRTLTFDFIKPACSIELEEFMIEDKTIFLYHVEQDVERVFSREDNDKVFLRVWDTNRELNREKVKKLEYDKGIRRFEEELVNDFEVEDLDEKLLEEYKNKLNYKDSIEDLLNARHLTKKVDNKQIFKNATILLFSKDPEKYIPSASIRYIRYEGTGAQVGKNYNVIKDERFEDNIPNLITTVKTFLRASFKDYYFLDIEVGKFKKIPEYPEDAWLEGVVNALCHRSYNMQGNVINIKHFDDRLEISNSGPLPAQVTIENIKTERFARNPRIARVLEDLGYVRQLNEGVGRIYESMEKSMLSEPEYKELNGNVYLTLRNKISEHSKTIHHSIIEKIEKSWQEYNETQKKILEYLFLNYKATISDFATYAKVNDRTIRRYLNDFVDKNILDRQSKKQRDINANYTFKRF